MTLLELKKSIHEKVDSLNDSDYLEQLNAMITYHDKKIHIPEEHLASIRRGEQDIKNGDFLTEEEFEKRYEKWLKD
jgi:predicted transcriptional regulator